MSRGSGRRLRNPPCHFETFRQRETLLRAVRVLPSHLVATTVRTRDHGTLGPIPVGRSKATRPSSQVAGSALPAVGNFSANLDAERGYVFTPLKGRDVVSVEVPSLRKKSLRHPDREGTARVHLGRGCQVVV